MSQYWHRGVTRDINREVTMSMSHNRSDGGEREPASDSPVPSEAERRADLLISRYARLTEGNPGFHYHLHMDMSDPVASALVESPHSRADLIPLMSDNNRYQTWRLRLEHPNWWIGLRAHGTTPLLHEVIACLAPTAQPEYLRIPVGRDTEGETIWVGCAPHRGASGFVGSHWVNQTIAAVTPLSDEAKAKLAVALRRELLGRNLCQGWPTWVIETQSGSENADPATVFPESEIDEDIDVDALTAAIAAGEGIHGTQWADAVRTMIGDLDLTTWPGVTDALRTETRTLSRP